MLRKKQEGCGALGRVTAVLLVLMMLMTLIAVGVVPITVDAATAALSVGESVNVYLQDSSWQGSNIRVRFLNSSDTELGSVIKTPSGNKITVTADVSGITKLKLEKVNSTKTANLTAMQNVIPADLSNKQVVFYDDASTKWGSTSGDPKFYAWKKISSSTTYYDQPWNDRRSMTKVSGTTDLYYAVINWHTNPSTAYENIIFTGNGKQTADLTLNSSTASVIKVYTSAENKWITYTDVERSLTVNVSDRFDDGLNDLYVTSKTTAKWSHYNSSSPKTTVYFKPNSNWTTAWVHYDDSDDEPYYTSVQMTQYSSNPLIYQADVYFGAMVSFSNDEDFESSSKKDQGSVFADADEPVYVARDRSWTTLDNAMASDEINYDYKVKSNNFASVTPSGGGRIVGFDATYYDYLSNNERTSGWRQGLVDDEFSDGYRKQFSNLNDEIISVAQSNSSWRYPMVFGDDYNASYFIDGYYNQISGSRSPSIDLDHFRAVNNSNFLDTGNDLSRSVMGLVQNKLSGGDLMLPGNLVAPYFDDEWLSGTTTTTQQMEVLYIIDNNNYGQNGIYANFWGGGDVLKDIHPEKVTDSAVTIGGVTGIVYKYVVDTKFTSVQLANSTNYGSHFYEYQANGQWVLGLESGVVKTGGGGGVASSTYVSGNQEVETTSAKRATIIDSKFAFVETTDPNTKVKSYVFDSGSRKDNIAFAFNNDNEPTAVNYYSGDGIVGKLDGNNGFFPFNDTSNNYPRNYGFGMRVDMDFTLPENGVFEGGTHAVFDYSGDDDVWVFVDGNLILDLGGAHTPTTGSIDFGYASGQIKATSDKVSAQLAPSVSSDNWKAGAGVNAYFNFNNTDPTKKHHMTVFYMERGTNDSNLKIEFSIQPVLNELDVYKEVQFEELNTGIDDEVMALAKDSVFGFTFNQDGSGYGGSTGKTFNYVHANDTTTTDTIRNGSFSLKHYEEAMFNNDTDLTYGSAITLSETLPSLYSYDTTIEVKDILNGEELPLVNGRSAAFDLKNHPNDPSLSDSEERTLMMAEFINTLKTTQITLNKELYKEDEQEISEDLIAFQFTIQLDIGDGVYRNYDLEYTFDNDSEIYIADGGVVQMRQDQEIEFFGIPVGAKYKITESDLAGYDHVSSKTVTGTVSSNGAAVVFKNKEAPRNTSMTVTKKLDGELYTGTEFEFKIELIEWEYNDPQNPYTDRTTLDPIYPTNIQTGVENGVITFDEFNIIPSNEHVGLYKFKITETDKSATQPWYSYDDAIFYAIIRVDSGSMDDPVYYTDEDCTVEVTGDGPEFVNETRLGSITITKEDANQTPLQNTRFALIKVSSEAEVDAHLTPDVINSVVGSSILDDDGRVQLMYTKADGTADFDDLPLYQKEGQFVYNASTQKIEWSTTVSPTAKQTYCVFEYTPSTGFLPNYTKGYVVLADEPNCSRTFGYVDGRIVMPNASGPGVRIFTVVGLAALLCGTVFGAGYVIKRRRKPAYVGRHIKK